MNTKYIDIEWDSPSKYCYLSLGIHLGDGLSLQIGKNAAGFDYIRGLLPRDDHQIGEVAEIMGRPITPELAAEIKKSVKTILAWKPETIFKHFIPDRKDTFVGATDTESAAEAALFIDLHRSLKNRFVGLNRTDYGRNEVYIMQWQWQSKPFQYLFWIVTVRTESWTGR